MVLHLRKFTSVSPVRVLFTLIGLAVGAPVGLAARMSPLQAQGVVTGTVSERGSLQPIALALVRVAGTDNAVTTNDSGRFRIRERSSGHSRATGHGLGIPDLRYCPTDGCPRFRDPCHHHHGE